jgi:hypothetical protein
LEIKRKDSTMKYLLFSLVFTGMMLGESSASKPEPQTLSAELRAKFWRAVAEQQSAKAAFERAVENAKATQEALRKACGGSAIVMNESGEPACEAAAAKQ